MFLELLVNPIKEYKYTCHNFIMINNRIINIYCPSNYIYLLNFNYNVA